MPFFTPTPSYTLSFLHTPRPLSPVIARNEAIQDNKQSLATTPLSSRRKPLFSLPSSLGVAPQRPEDPGKRILSLYASFLMARMRIPPLASLRGA
jgi:hypothetical protein